MAGDICDTIRYDIFMAGDISQAKQVCRDYCYSVGLCVTIEKVDYIYTGGEEVGFRVGLINYPRFPSNTAAIEAHACNLAEALRQRLFQHSYSIVGPAQTQWISSRDDTR